MEAGASDRHSQAEPGNELGFRACLNEPGFYRYYYRYRYLLPTPDPDSCCADVLRVCLCVTLRSINVGYKWGDRAGCCEDVLRVCLYVALRDINVGYQWGNRAAKSSLKPMKRQIGFRILVLHSTGLPLTSCVPDGSPQIYISSFSDD
jgi:hypothetical protein